MKKRLLSLALCLAILLPTLLLFTSCEEEEIEATGTIAPMTIVIAMITDDETNQAGIDATEKALNRITENNFNTHVELKFYKESEYYDAVETALLARRKAVNDGDKSTSVGSVKDTVYDEEKNREVTAYPEPYENQIDIFFVGSSEKLLDYVMWKADTATDEEYAADPYLNSDPLVAGLDEDIPTAGALLGKYLSSGLMNAGKVSFAGAATQYAIPSNAIYNKGEYMVVDKKLFDASPYSIEEVSNVIALEEFLLGVANEHGGSVVPLYNLGSMGFVSLTGKTSVLSQMIDSSTAITASGVEPASILSNLTFRNILTSANKYSPAGYPKAGSDLSNAKTGEFAVGFIAATEDEIAAYEEDYYVIESHKAMVSTEQACSNMFAVSAFTSDTTRCVQIINLLQTNAKAHNILVYGEENVTYTVDDNTNMVKRMHEGDYVYLMDIHKTGNLFITYQNTEMSAEELIYSANDWALAKSVSRHVFFGPYIGFQIAYKSETDEPTEFKPSAAFADNTEKAYYTVIEEAFKFNTYAKDEETGYYVDGEGKPFSYKEKGKEIFVTDYASYLNYLDATYVNVTSVMEGQISDVNGTIYNQFIAWRRLHYLTGEA